MAASSLDRTSPASLKGRWPAERPNHRGPTAPARAGLAIFTIRLLVFGLGMAGHASLGLVACSPAVLHGGRLPGQRLLARSGWDGQVDSEYHRAGWDDRARPLHPGAPGWRGARLKSRLRSTSGILALALAVSPVSAQARPKPSLASECSTAGGPQSCRPFRAHRTVIHHRGWERSRLQGSQIRRHIDHLVRRQPRHRRLHQHDAATRADSGLHLV
jgi:hypothetical protein